ncbi:hypothetical protein [Campylobacter rectus]|uniref:hypothetical protein n=1 Tax=Campylobacter rectus TaxID=203 RepID=UPI0021AB418C|nr:hypothetical protein [Campylobacter rectus]
MTVRDTAQTGASGGGDILKARGKGCERVCRFDEILLIGGEASAKNIRQIACRDLKI